MDEKLRLRAVFLNRYVTGFPTQVLLIQLLELKSTQISEKNEAVLLLRRLFIPPKLRSRVALKLEKLVSSSHCVLRLIWFEVKKT